MLSLLKMASALSLVRRSCDSWSLLMGRPISAVRMPTQCRRPAAPLEDRPLARDERALLAALELVLEGPDDLHVGVAHPLPAPLLADLEQGIDRVAWLRRGRWRSRMLMRRSR